MRKWIGKSRLLMLLLVVILAASGGSALRPADTTIGAQLDLSADQTSVGVAIGGDAVFAVVVSQPGSLLGPISLSVTGAPVGATLTYPHTVLSGVPAVISVLTTASTPVGTVLLKITATSGATTQTITVKLVISLATGFTMVLSPPSQTVVDGGTTSYGLSINRGLLAGAVALQVQGLPAHATASVSPSLSLLGNSATVTVNVPTNVVPGAYEITVKGAALLSSATASAYLIVVPQTYPAFPISDSFASGALTPGGPTLPVDVTMTDPFSAPMTVTGITVSITGILKNGQPVTGCSAADFALTQYAGPATLTVPGGQTRSLSTYSPTIPPSQWPRIQMIDRSLNQDECKSVTVVLGVTATGSGA